MAETAVWLVRRHCEERSDEAIQPLRAKILDCFASLAMTAILVRELVRDGLQQQIEPDPAAADEAGGRQHAVARSGGARAGSDPARQGARPDLLARHDGRAARHRLRL